MHYKEYLKNKIKIILDVQFSYFAFSFNILLWTFPHAIEHTLFLCLYHNVTLA